jgi:hypothetical protein
MGNMIKLAMNHEDIKKLTKLTWKDYRNSESIKKGLKTGIIGGVGGAIVGNVAGRMTSKGKDQEERKKHIRNRTAQGMLAGGVGGGVGGAASKGLGMGKLYKENPFREEMKSRYYHITKMRK